MSEAWTGQCYCGSTKIVADSDPLTTTYCHCSNCRRITGAPVAAFAAFSFEAVDVIPDRQRFSANPGVTRQFCPTCGSQLTAAFDYLPGHIYVPVGILDQAAELVPELHCHFESKLTWLNISDNLERHDESGRNSLNSKSKP